MTYKKKITKLTMIITFSAWFLLTLNIKTAMYRAVFNRILIYFNINEIL